MCSRPRMAGTAGAIGEGMTLPPGSDIRMVSMAERNRRIYAAIDSGQFSAREIAEICGTYPQMVWALAYKLGWRLEHAA